MKKLICVALSFALMLLPFTAFAQGKDSTTGQDNRDGWSISTKKDGYLGRVRVDSDGLHLELADGQTFHSPTLAGWESIKVNHPEIMPLVDAGYEQLAPNVDEIAIGAIDRKSVV